MSLPQDKNTNLHRVEDFSSSNSSDDVEKPLFLTARRPSTDILNRFSFRPSSKQPDSPPSNKTFARRGITDSPSLSAPSSVESSPTVEKPIMIAINVVSINAMRKMKHSPSQRVEQVINHLVKRNPELQGDIILQDPRTGVCFEENRTLSSYLLKDGDIIDAKVRTLQELLSITVRIRHEREEFQERLLYTPETKVRGIVQLLPNRRFNELECVKVFFKGQSLAPTTLLYNLFPSTKEEVLPLFELHEDIKGPQSLLHNVQLNKSAVSFPETVSARSLRSQAEKRNSLNLSSSNMNVNLTANTNTNTILTGMVLVKIQSGIQANSTETFSKFMNIDLSKSVEEVMPQVLKRFPADPNKKYTLTLPKGPGRDKKVVMNLTDKLGLYTINSNDVLILKEAKEKRPSRDRSHSVFAEKKEKKDKEKDKDKDKDKDGDGTLEKKRRDRAKSSNPDRKSKVFSFKKKAKPVGSGGSSPAANATDAPTQGLDPDTIDEVIAYLEQNALELEGIFRLSAGSAQTKEFCKSIIARDVKFTDLESPHVVSCGLKQYLRELPQPLFPSDQYSKYIAIGRLPPEERVKGLKEQLALLSETNKAVLYSLMTLLKHTSEKSHINMMIPANLGIVFGPTLLRSDNPNNKDAMFESEFQINIVETLIEEFDEIFEVDEGTDTEEVHEPKEPVPGTETETAAPNPDDLESSQSELSTCEGVSSNFVRDGVEEETENKLENSENRHQNQIHNDNDQNQTEEKKTNEPEEPSLSPSNKSPEQLDVEHVHDQPQDKKEEQEEEEDHSTSSTEIINKQERDTSLSPTSNNHPRPPLNSFDSESDLASTSFIQTEHDPIQDERVRQFVPPLPDQANAKLKLPTPSKTAVAITAIRTPSIAHIPDRSSLSNKFFRPQTNPPPPASSQLKKKLEESDAEESDDEFDVEDDEDDGLKDFEDEASNEE